jgi:germacradienol/geosmin synthase
MDARMRTFEHVVSTGLPALFGELDLDADARATLAGYARALQNWMAGILNWHEDTGRYDEAELRRRYQAAPRRFGAPPVPRTAGVVPPRPAPNRVHAGSGHA